MTKEELRTELLKILNLTGAPAEQQDAILAQVEATANEQFALDLPGMLSEEQLKNVEKMRTDGKDDETIRQWIESQVDDYEGRMQDIILDVADEIAAGMKAE